MGDKKSVLITGGAGFGGSGLAKELLNRTLLILSF